VPLLSTVGVLSIFRRVVRWENRTLPPSVQRYALATRFRAAGYQAAADEIIHIRESVSEVRSSRRKLNDPFVVVTGARGADENWAAVAADLTSLPRNEDVDDRSTVRSRGIGRPTRGRCGRDPRDRGYGERPERRALCARIGAGDALQKALHQARYPHYSPLVVSVIGGVSARVAGRAARSHAGETSITRLEGSRCAAAGYGATSQTPRCWGERIRSRGGPCSGGASATPLGGRARVASSRARGRRSPRRG